MEIFKYIFFGIISCFFLYFNYKIILSDIQKKIIPNKYLKNLLLILPFYYILLFIFTPAFFVDVNTVHIGMFIIQIFLTLGIGFSLYYFGLWGAGDAKYLVVLGFFIPHLGIIPFLENIALLVILYLFLYFLWFYLGKCFIKKGYARRIFKSVKKDLIDKLTLFLKNSDNTKIDKKIAFLKILKWLVFFLIIFVSMRLLRIYIFADIQESKYYEDIYTNIKSYSSYIIFLIFLTFLGLLFGIRYVISKSKNFILEKTNIKDSTIIDTIFLGILSLGLISFILYEYSINKDEIINYLTSILTFYILLYIIFKILRYSYHITFQLNEQDFIKIDALKTGDIIDKEFLINIFGEQGCIGFCMENAKKIEHEQKKYLILYPKPKDYFLKIQNPIDNETKDLLIKIYSIVNNYHETNKSSFFSKITDIKILKTFALGGYIFLGFLITFFIGDKIFSDLIGYFLKFIFPS